MTTRDAPEEVMVGIRVTVTIPASLRRRLDIEPGDKLRWDTDEDGDLVIEAVRQRYGAFADDDLKAPLGGDGFETHDLAGREDEAAFTEDN